MGLISTILQKDAIEWDFSALRSVLGMGPTKSGVTVTESTALRHITVQSCVRVRSETLGSFSLSVFRRRKDGKGSDEAWDHPVYDLVHSVPNDEMTSITWRQFMNANLDLSGNGYSIITSNKRGQVIDLYPWAWDKIEPRRNLETNKLEYRVIDRGKSEILPPSKVLHVPGWCFDGIKGHSVIHLAREAVGLGMAINEFSSRFYGQGMNVGMVIEGGDGMKQETADRLREQFLQKGAGLANSWLPIVLHGGLKLNRIPMPLTDAQFIETYKLNRDEICGLYRVQPHLIANLERSTNNNIEHQGIEFVKLTMLPLIASFEQAMNWKLFTPQEREEGYYVKFNVDALLRGDAKARAEALQIKRRNGIINADEWRELDEQNPIGGLAGTTYFVEANMASAETLAKQLPKQQQPASEPGKEVS